jgi:hypothetical protein
MKGPNSEMQLILDVPKALVPLPIENLEAELARQIPLLDCNS